MALNRREQFPVLQPGKARLGDGERLPGNKRFSLRGRHSSMITRLVFTQRLGFR